MSYQVLARKWRPQTFKDLVGQDHISSTLCNAIKNERIGHAYLFVGTRGTGKTTTARIFAKAINCENPAEDANPCGECVNCIEITSGSSMDVLEIDGASNNGVDDIRRLRENVQYTPARCKYKVYIIDEVHMLSTAAWNALLKTLEEPPEHVKFLFATTEVHKVLPTILSRCQRFDLKRISQGTISRRLKKIADKENAAFDDSALNSISRAANGGMRDALSIMDQMIAFCSDNDVITEHDVADVFGLTSNADLAKITASILNNDAATLINEINRIADMGRNLEQLYNDLMMFSRNLLICAISKDQAEDILDLDDSDLQSARDIASQTSADIIQKMVDGFINNDNRLRNTLNKRVFIEMTLIRIMKDAHAVSLNDILKRLNHFRKTGSLDSIEISAPDTTAVTLDTAQKKTELKTESPEKSEEVLTSQPENTTEEPVPELDNQPNPEHNSQPEQVESTVDNTPVEESKPQEKQDESDAKEPAASIDNLEEENKEPPETLESETVATPSLKEDEIEPPKPPRTTPPKLDSPKTRRVIDDSYEVPYSTLVDADYISEARKQDPLKLGLKKHQGDFNTEEETPGSALGLYYADDEKPQSAGANEVNESNPSISAEPEMIDPQPEGSNPEVIQEVSEKVPEQSEALYRSTAAESEVTKENKPGETQHEPAMGASENNESNTVNEPAEQPYIPQQAPASETITQKDSVNQEPAPESDSDAEKAHEIWGEMQKRSSQAADACSHIKPVSLHENIFIAALDADDGDKTEVIRKKLETVLQKVSGLEELELKFIAASDEDDEDNKLSSGDEVWDRAKDSPFFSQICEAFDGKIIDVRG